MSQELVTELVSFDPNSLPSDLWASYVPSRSPKFKVFTYLNHAQQGPRTLYGSVYLWDTDGSWLLHEIWVDGKEVYR